ncbi:uncharacterized protein LOC132564029 [Ylistrum balloti]|uniref:uncharacterized protein LOC132564029 n=1 Tax=Ylistrum balloti TaxID=509963 RepID=UPI002905B57F|nr:uncharacterized protein LOC132564029 [Ylistrum balloti]
MDRYLWLCFILAACWFVVVENTAEYQIVDQRVPCPYYGLESNRFTMSNDGLVNCSWYAQKTCCKRTEVTSVFSNMFSLYGATKNCKNHMNYLMCYFCDPEQYRWYKSKAHVCADFCRAVFEHCQDAEFDGKSIGTNYRNGTDFCEAQNFHVVEGDNCFDYDPTVFGRAQIAQRGSLELLAASIIGFLLIIQN